MPVSTFPFEAWLATSVIADAETWHRGINRLCSASSPYLPTDLFNIPPISVSLLVPIWGLNWLPSFNLHTTMSSLLH